jgi:predicted secreted protein
MAMALAKVSKFSEFLLKIGDGASPEVFSAPCGLTSRSFDLTASTNDQTVPDCSDDDLAAWTARAIDALSGTISGSGVMDRTSLADYRTWFLSTLPKNCRIQIVATGANGGGYFEGSFLLTKLTLGGERGQKATVEIELQSDGAITWTAAVP